ncbi:hypothetical protein BC941DRAFT_351970, partial [Chlamydoabsidia padenii]
FTHGGKIDSDQLVQTNSSKLVQSLNIMSSLGVNSSGYNKLLSTSNFYDFNLNMDRQ